MTGLFPDSQDAPKRASVPTDDLAMQVGHALLRNGTLQPLMAQLRLETLKLLQAVGRAPAKSFSAAIDRACAKLVSDWLGANGLTFTLAAMEIESLSSSWLKGSTPGMLEDYFPPRFSPPAFPYALPQTRDISSEAQGLVQALCLDDAPLVEIHARLANLFLEEAWHPGQRTRPVPLDKREKVVAALVVDQWLLEKSLLHTRDVLRAETGVALDSTVLPASYSLVAALKFKGGLE